MQEEYVPAGITKEAPPYIPKKKITIQEYRERLTLQEALERDPTAEPRPRKITTTREKEDPHTTKPVEIKQQRKRGGKLVKQRKELAALYALVRDDNTSLTWDQNTRIYERIDQLHLDRTKNFHQKKNENYGNYRIQGANKHQ